MAISSYLSFNHGRIATQPLRSVAIALYVSVFVVDQLFRYFEWCGSAVNGSQVAATIGLLLILCVMEFAEQRVLGLTRPTLLVAVVLIGSRIGLTELLNSYECSGFHQFLMLIPPLLAYLYIGHRAAIFTAVLAILLYLRWFGADLFTLSSLAEENIFVELFIFLVGMMFVLVMGRVLVLEERNRQRAEQLVVELEQSQQQVAELAMTDERNRIARDIHDSVGHHLTAVNIQLEKAIAFRSIDATQADQALLDAKRSAKSALADVRDSVSTLREPDRQYSLSTELKALVAGYPQLPISLNIVGDESHFTSPTLLALYRVAQEGLTNITKHAEATAIDLSLNLNRDNATLVLNDNGLGIDLAQLEARSEQDDAHFGLIGLRERLETVGGTLEVSSQPKQGTTLRVNVPARGLT